MTVMAISSYAVPMSDRPTVHRNQIAEARNVLGEVISRARYAGEPTVLINRGKEAAVIVSYPFYEQALRDREILEELRHLAAVPPGASAEDHPEIYLRARVLFESLSEAEQIADS